MNKNAWYAVTTLLVLVLAVMMLPPWSGMRLPVHANNPYASELDDYFADYMENPSGEGNLFGYVNAPIVLSINVPLYSLAYAHDTNGVVCVKPTIKNHSTCPVEIYLFPVDEPRDARQQLVGGGGYSGQEDKANETEPEFIGTVYSLDQISLQIENGYRPTAPNSRVLECRLTFEISMSP